MESPPSEAHLSNSRLGNRIANSHQLAQQFRPRPFEWSASFIDSPLSYLGVHHCALRGGCEIRLHVSLLYVAHSTCLGLPSGHLSNDLLGLPSGHLSNDLLDLPSGHLDICMAGTDNGRLHVSLFYGLKPQWLVLSFARLHVQHCSSIATATAAVTMILDCVAFGSSDRSSTAEREGQNHRPSLG